MPGWRGENQLRMTAERSADIPLGYEGQHRSRQTCPSDCRLTGIQSLLSTGRKLKFTNIHDIRPINDLLSRFLIDRSTIHRTPPDASDVGFGPYHLRHSTR
jgi:hypothetical protein